jgi:hypothetical protein
MDEAMQVPESVERPRAGVQAGSCSQILKERMMTDDVMQVQQTVAGARPWAEAVEPYKEARARLEEVTRVAFHAVCRALFDAHPGLQSFAWQQHTHESPSGVLSEEHVCKDDPDINGTPGHDVAGGHNWDDDTGEWLGEGEPSPEARLQRAVAEMLKAFDDEDLLKLFHVNVTVTVRRDGTTVETGECESETVNSCLCQWGDSDGEDCESRRRGTIKIRYGPQETGPAELLGGGLARISDPVLIPEEEGLWQGDIVRLTHLPSDADGHPEIAEVVYRQYEHTAYLHITDQAEAVLLHAVLRLVGADSFVVFPPTGDRPGVLAVAHQEGLDPVGLAESIGIPQGPGDGDEERVRRAIFRVGPRPCSQIETRPIAPWK